MSSMNTTQPVGVDAPTGQRHDGDVFFKAARVCAPQMSEARIAVLHAIAAGVEAGGRSEHPALAELAESRWMRGRIRASMRDLAEHFQTVGQCTDHDGLLAEIDGIVRELS